MELIGSLCHSGEPAISLGQRPVRPMKYDKILPARLQWKAVAPVHRIRNADMRAWLFGLPLPPFVAASGAVPLIKLNVLKGDS